MAPQEGKPVELCLFTPDDDLERVVRAGLEAAGLDNDVHRIDPGTSADAIAAQGGNIPRFVLLDMREPNESARAFLAALDRPRDTAAPLVVLVADRDSETGGLSAHAQIIAGRVSSDLPVEDLIRLVDDVLSEHWAVEDRPAVG